MRIMFFSIACMCLLSHQAQADNLAEHSAIEKYIDHETVLVAWIDISKLNTDQLADLLEKVDAPAIPEREMSKLKAVHDALLQFKASRIYWLSDLASIAEGPLRLVIPCENPQAVQLLLGAMSESDVKFEVDGNTVLGLFGAKAKGLAVLKEQKGAPSPQLISAIAACKKDHGMAFATPSYVTMTIMAILKSESKKDDASELIKAAAALSGLQWLALAASLKPEELSFEMHTESPASAGQLRDFIRQLVEQRFKAAADRLTFDVNGSAVQYSSSSIAETVEAIHALTSNRGSMHTANSMKQVALALHNYADSYKHLPPQSLVNGQGKRLLSWRVLILPFLEQQALFEQFHLDEPWDSPHNLELAKIIPSPYASDQTPRSGLLTEEGLVKTRIVAPMTKDSAFGRPGKPLWFSDFKDGTSNSLWFVEAAPEHAVIWTKPEDLPIDTNHPVGSIIGKGDEGFLGSMVDGSVRFYSAEINDDTLNALLTIDGGEVIDNDEIK